MTTCTSCEKTFDAEDLTRHEQAGMVVVHCPDCGQTLGRYNRHSR